jgi:hypothetical protein
MQYYHPCHPSYIHMWNKKRIHNHITTYNNMRTKNEKQKHKIISQLLLQFARLLSQHIKVLYKCRSSSARMTRRWVTHSHSHVFNVCPLRLFNKLIWSSVYVYVHTSLNSCQLTHTFILDVYWLEFTKRNIYKQHVWLYFVTYMHFTYITWWTFLTIVVCAEQKTQTIHSLTHHMNKRVHTTIHWLHWSIHIQLTWFRYHVEFTIVEWSWCWWSLYGRNLYSLLYCTSVE